VGGGGFTHEADHTGIAHATGRADAMLEDRLLALAPPQPNIGFIGHASMDDLDRISRFYARFQNLAKTSHLPVSDDSKAAQAFVAPLDILYVGGGSTLNMLHHWRQTGIDRVLIDAAHQGMILSGVSAGAICWFEDLLLSDAGDRGNGYVHATGLGLLGGSACPHYHNEAPRKAAFDGQIAAGNMSAGLAIDDGVAVYISNGVLRDIVRAGSGNAFWVEHCDDMAMATPIKIGHKLPTSIQPREMSHLND
jgi:peptidase E